MQNDDVTRTVLVCARNPNLCGNLEASLRDSGFVVSPVATQEEAIAVLKAGPCYSMIAEMRRDAFAALLRFSANLHPKMPVQLIDGNAVFCLYPLARQPHDLIEAIRAAGVSVSPMLLRNSAPAPPRVQQDAYLLQ
jgi:hypothetical protein